MEALYTIDDGTKFENGYFIKNPNQTYENYNSDGDFVVTLDNNSSLKERLIKIIESAEHYIKICSFIISDKEIVGVIEDVLKTNKVAVFILTSVRMNQFKSNFLRDDETVNDYKEEHFTCIDKLLRKGAHIRAHEGAHAKFIISDGSKALLMSANMNETSLNINPESGVLIPGGETINKLEHIFDVIYLYGTEFQRIVPTRDLTHYIVKTPSINDKMFPEPNGGGLRWTFGSNQNFLYNDIIEITKNAKSKLDIATYSIVGLEKIQELTKAIDKYINKKNGKLRLFCRAMNHRSDHLKGCRKLTDLGCTIFGDVYNHSKGMVSDSNQGMIFTANIDGKHGLTNGFEMGFNISKEEEYLDSLRDFINWQIDTAPYLFVQTTSYKDLKAFYEHHYDVKKVSSPIKFENEVQVMFRSEKVGEKLINDLINDPPYFSFLKDNKNYNNYSFIRVGENYYKLIKENNNNYNLDSEIESSNKLRYNLQEEYLWFYNKLSIVKER